MLLRVPSSRSPLAELHVQVERAAGPSREDQTRPSARHSRVGQPDGEGTACHPKNRRPSHEKRSRSRQDRPGVVVGDCSDVTGRSAIAQREARAASAVPGRPPERSAARRLPTRQAAPRDALPAGPVIRRLLGYCDFFLGSAMLRHAPLRATRCLLNHPAVQTAVPNRQGSPYAARRLLLCCVTNALSAAASTGPRPQPLPPPSLLQFGSRYRRSIALTDV